MATDKTHGFMRFQRKVLPPSTPKPVREAKELLPAAAPEHSLFRPFPAEVVFRNYVPWEVYEAPLTLRNTDKVPRLVKVILESSPYFRLLSPSGVCCKVAPGLQATFSILFRPEENKDYFHQLICVTEREKFTVPIRATGARAVLDFPAQLNFSVCPVKCSTQKTLLVHNLGNREARYSISTQSPFSVDCSFGTLGIGDSMQVTVEFHPLQTGGHSGSLMVHYDTGEDIQTSLCGVAVDVNIGLERSCLMFDKTYLTLSHQRSVVIHNRSEVTARFQWKAFATEEEEDERKLRLCHRAWRKEQEKVDHLLQECRGQSTLREGVALVSRVFQQQRARIQEDALLFSDDVFTIEPLEGEIQPKSSAEVTVVFTPREARSYRRTIYCDISGRETRLPLCVQGEGKGPLLRLSFEQLDIGEVFVGSAHSYEVILFNKGAIDAAFSLLPPITALGSCFTFQPQEGLILPDGLQVIQISFSSTILGHFTEEFRFHVAGCPKPVTLTVRGCVIKPRVHFSVPSLHFGQVSFGFPRTLMCRLTNSSSAPITFSLHIPGDGSGEPSTSSLIQISDNTHPSWRRGARGCGNPTEFSIRPCRGTIVPQGSLAIQVSLCSNTVRTYELALVLEVDGVGEVCELPITASCVVPALRVLSPIVRFGRCFLRHPHQQMLTLVNDSDLPGCYGLLPQEHREGAAVWFSSPVPCGIIQAHSSVCVPIAVEAQELGERDTIAHMAVFGRAKSPLKIHLVSVGEGPVVHVHPSDINFGTIQALQDASQRLYLSNQSLIPAPFRAEMAGKRSRWRIEPSQGVIPPSTEVSVAVIANLDDTEEFKDKVKVLIENSLSYDIPVQAVGVGTTIVIDKPFAPELNLGAHFSLDRCCHHFNATNRGRRAQLLYWTTEGFSPFCRQDPLPPSTGIRGKDSTQSPKPACPVFKLRPLRMELMPGQTMEMTLEGFSSTPQVVKERLLCHTVGRSKAWKQQVMQVDVTCQFIVPTLQISPGEVTFQVKQEPSGDLTLQHKPLSLKNTSPLPFSIILALEQPFSICDAEQQPLPADIWPTKLEVGQELHLSIAFNPAYEEGLQSRVAKKTLSIQFLEHPHVEQVRVRGEVCFPNLHIQSKAVDFGCILNHTQAVHHITMTNCSQLPAHYHWGFLVGSHGHQMRFSPPAPKFFLEAQPPKEKGTHLEQSSSAESSCRAGSMEELPKALGEAEDPAQEPAHADDSLGAKLLPSTAVELEEASETQSLEEDQELLCVGTEPFTPGMEEVFDVLPLHGMLPPGQSCSVTFTFFGHPNVVAQATALCRVEGGPSYEVTLRGEASVISHGLSTTQLDCGLQPFSQVSQAEVTVQNRGKMGFPCVVLSPSPAPADRPLVLPSTVYLGPGEEQVLKVYYLPAVPGVFCRTFHIQVGHLEPEAISLKGEASFPRVCLDLPRNFSGNEKYKKVLQEVKEKLEKQSQRDEAAAPEEAAEPPTDGTVLDTQLQMQVEDMLIEEHALKQQKAFASSPKDGSFDQGARQRLVRAELPEYVLEFGHVVVGDSHRRLVKVTNTGKLPVSFQADGQALCGTGFTVEPAHVKDLPCTQSQTLAVSFHPQSCHVPLGEVNLLLPIQVAGGPVLRVRLCASVAEPTLSLSRDRLQFCPVLCGQCQEETVRLYNRLQVPCEWFITTTTEPVKKLDTHVLGSRHQKPLRALKDKPRVFEVLPLAGSLAAGQWCDVQVRFSPRAEKSYRSSLKVNIQQSSQQLQLQVSGRGLQPRLELSPSTLELGPSLPGSRGAEGTVVVKNPCDFPVEFYSLEFDQQYLTEEKILRMLKDYDSHNTLMLPPRAPGEKLPPEVLQFWEDQKRQQDEQEKPRTEEATEQGDGEEHQPSATGSQEAVGEATNSPVRSALARHLGTSSSAEAATAQSRRGIVIIVHGAPLAGKSSVAAALAGRYGAACLAIDAVVTAAVSEGSSAAGLQARELCLRAAIQHSQEQGDAPSTKESSENSHSSSGDRASSWSLDSLSSSSFTESKRKQELDIRSSTAEGLSCMSCVLPEDLLVTILSERLQLSDCYQGVVIDGLETLFSCHTVCALLCLLKAIGNRPYIYMVNLCQDYASWKAREMAAKEQEEREREEAARREKARLWEMDEDEYDALPEEQKMQFNSQIRQEKRERRKREMQRLALELAQKKQLERLEKQRQREARRASRRASRFLLRQHTTLSTGSTHEATGKSPVGTKGLDTKGSGVELQDPAARKKRRQSKAALTDSIPLVVPQPSEPEQGEEQPEAQSDTEDALALRFDMYEVLQKGVTYVLSSWDRAQGALLSPLKPEELWSKAGGQHQRPSSHRRHKDREKGRLQKEQLEQLKAPGGSKLPYLEGAEGSSKELDVGVPCLNIEVLSSKGVTTEVLESDELPAAEQVLDHLGLGPSGPPIAPTTFYSVIRYPEERVAPGAGEALRHFVLVVPDTANKEEEKEDTKHVDVPVEPTEKVLGLDGAGWGLSSGRWVVPAHGEVELRVHFSSTLLGQFEQTLHFEIQGTKALYQLQCRGTCLYPTISQDPRVVFPRCRRSKAHDAIVSKQFVLSTGVFHFGPLLCGKSRNWYEALAHPGNHERLSILNTTALEAELSFSFEHHGDTFHLDPPSMRLKPNEKRELNVWAYPTAAGLVEDKLICHIRDNPEPVTFSLCCQGVKVQLEVSPKRLRFDRLLLYRTDSKSLVLQNRTLLPVAWKLHGLGNLGGSFSVSQDQGVLGPRTELSVQLRFKATKVLRLKEKIRLEVSDAENLLGTVQIETIQVVAEAYDVGLTINIPNSADDRVDFGTIPVLGEVKQELTLKNKGQYPVAYSFKLEAAGTKIRNLASHFTVQPQKGVLSKPQHSAQVQLLFHPKAEMSTEDKAILSCQVIEPNTPEGGETVAIIPVKVSAKAAFRHYSISPASLLDLGVVEKGNRKTCTFTLANTGILDFQFLICKADREAPELPWESANPVNPTQSSSTAQETPLEQQTAAMVQTRLALGMFTLHPAFGSIAAGGQRIIRVEYYAGVPGLCQEQLSIHVSGRDPKDHPLGIPYTLAAECCARLGKS
ncbi:hydrocephalus-inducing protein homolog [Colius striatus]|uniref:hydrocephalus-inducing protein homolog n=1 Tax=Colius striatus TaxID=57412 RepID=UPI002B1E6480|nr:hydrocephalus-inducing protein homolog [Colius striatus]